MKYNITRAVSIFLAASLWGLAGCKKFVEIHDPTTQITSTDVYESNASAAAVLTGIYSQLMSNSVQFASGTGSISFCAGLAADELTNYATSIENYSQYFTNSLTAASQNTAPFWNAFYQYIYVANTAIEKLPGSTGVSSNVKMQLLGEAYFMRAFLYFYAVNLFGSVPLATTTNYEINNSLHQSSSSEVYQEIVGDLQTAKAFLSTNYLAADAQTPSSDRVRPTKWAAAALLARVYLYTNMWTEAKTEADTVLANTALFSLPSDLTTVFLNTSQEAIWQLEPVVQGYNTFDAYYFILTGPPGNTGNNYVAMSPFILSAFEPGDQRFQQWVDSLSDGTTTYYYPYKYRQGGYNVGNPVTEYLMVLRLAEQYLIRAEAEAELNDASDAQTDLNTVRLRAGLQPTSAITTTDLMAAIQHERQVELFTEWGHRWLDLKRTSSINSTMSVVCPQKGGNWNADWALFPIPETELKINSNLIQNPGYN